MIDEINLELTVRTDETYRGLLFGREGASSVELSDRAEVYD
jgi:hypothetical protein